MTDTDRADREGTAQARPRMAGNPDPPVVSSGPLGWNGLIAERYRHAPTEHHFPPLPEDTASLYLGEPMRSVRWSEDRIHEGPTSRGDVTVKASGQPVGWHFDRDVDLLVMRFEPAFLVRVAEENGLDPDAARLRPSFDGRDEAVKHIGRAMLAEIEDGGPALWPKTWYGRSAGREVTDWPAVSCDGRDRLRKTTYRMM